MHKTHPADIDENEDSCKLAWPKIVVTETGATVTGADDGAGGAASSDTRASSLTPGAALT